MQITFLGAARQVTGSMHLLRLDNGFSVLIDCGMEMERGDFEPQKGADNDQFFPFSPTEIDLVLLTHAHLDHSGNIPLLYKYGYDGQVLCTKPTAVLTEILLFDAVSINKKKLEGLRKKYKKSSNQKTYTADGLFLDRQVEECLQNMVTIPFSKPFKANDFFEVTFNPAGHLLGAANLIIKIIENGETKTIGFSGDVGRRNYPLLQDPVPLPEVDYLICETTYGGREHKATEEAEAILERVITETCIEKKGRLIIPAFSIGRSQSVLYLLHKLFKEKKMYPIKIYADSPMAMKSMYAYENFHQQLNQDAQNFRKRHGSLFDFENLVYVDSAKQSKQIASHHESCIILSSSGMLTGGRINIHLEKNLGNPYCTVLVIGFAAENTPGYALMTKQSSILLKGNLINIKAKIEVTDVLSGHADNEDLLHFVSSQNPNKLKRIFLVHGEESSMLNFQSQLQTIGYQTEVPYKWETFELN